MATSTITADTTGLTGVSSTLNSASSSSSTTATNPNSVLDKDSFMTLLLTELQYQDPTSPMDTEKILTQTSQLATLESADNTNAALAELTTQLSNSQNYNAISAIGKMASLGSNTISLPDSGGTQFDVYFPNEIESGTLTISDLNGNIVKSVDLSNQAGNAGNISFNWDGTDSMGKALPAGSYSVTADYTDASGAAMQTQYGIFPVDSVKYDSGTVTMKLGNSYVPMSNIKEFF
ncbi:FlgD immunoglobulin-like domain containing protein [Sulfurospirillum sp. 1612]|uniref:FlgD immunoglobulin-like domain containing protein n=1 Tax=Sulfurospirillum sp. 1612 TaxID=3094835 RepID=UPI002F93EADA